MEPEWPGNHAREIILAKGQRLTARNLWLIGVACCWRVAHLVTKRNARDCLRLVRQVADHRAHRDSLARMLGWATPDHIEGASGFAEDAIFCITQPSADSIIKGMNRCCTAAHLEAAPENRVFAWLDDEPILQDSEAGVAAYAGMLAVQNAIVRDAVAPRGFVPNGRERLALDCPEGREAIRMAEGAYRTGDMRTMGIISDAVEEAGLDAPRLLEHLRSREEHWPGCWALDWLTGRRWA